MRLISKLPLPGEQRFLTPFSPLTSFSSLLAESRCDAPLMNSKSPLLSTLVTLAGCAIVFGSLMLTVVFPQLHLGVLVVVGGLLGESLDCPGHATSSSVDFAGGGREVVLADGD